MNLKTFLEQLLTNPLAIIVDYYASCLPANPKAVDYLERNALGCANADVSSATIADHAEQSRTMPIGFADRSLGKHIPAKSLKQGKAIRSQLEALGVYRANGREHFRGFVTVPLHSTIGQVTGIYGRRIDRHGEGDAEQYIGQGIFNAMAIGKYEELIVTDNVLDAWTFYAAEHTNVICPVGYQLQINDMAGVRRLILAADTIDCEPFSQCQIHRLPLPLGHTVNSYAVERAHEADPLAKLIRNAAYVRGAGRDTSPASNPGGEGLDTQCDTDKNTSVTASAESTTATASVIVPGHRDRDPHSLQSSPVPGIVDEFDVESTDTETTISIETRRWRIRGLERNTVPGVIKVNVMVYNERSDRFHVDSFDLYHARSRRTFLAEAAEEIGAAEPQLRSDLGRVLLKLEELQHQQSQRAKTPVASVRALTEDEKTAALELLRDENLLDRILDDFETCGIVGERTGKLVGYLAATSRLLDKPLGLIIQSSSAAGKTSLADAILRFMPEEERFTCSAMTSQSLYYLGNENLKHKILSIAEQEGVRDASYQLKLLQSEGSLSLVSTSKEKGSGRTSAERYTVEGPVALLLTTTATDIDPELMNRCLVVSVDESPAQTAAIHAQQRFRETLEGFMQNAQSESRIQVHRNAQRLLRRLPVFNPYADQLTFVDWETRHRRDHGKYLGLIKAITLVHQHQREIKTLRSEGQAIEYLEVSKQDIARANHIADWALGRSIDDLAEPTRRLLVELYDWLKQQSHNQQQALSEVRFTRRAARETLHWRSTQLNYHLERLCRDEYVVRASGGNGKLCQYRLLYDGKGREGQPCLLQLVDPSKLAEPKQPMPMSDDLSG